MQQSGNLPPASNVTLAAPAEDQKLKVGSHVQILLKRASKPDVVVAVGTVADMNAKGSVKLDAVSGVKVGLCCATAKCAG